MPSWVSDQISQINQGLTGGVAVAGVAGSPTFPRVTEVRGIEKVYRWTFELATPNPVPGQPATPVPAQGDTLIIAVMKPTDRIIFGRVYQGPTWGAGVTLSFGKQDSNNATNTDPAHYLAASSFAAAPGTSYDFNLNMTEQVGADPIGDQTTGQLIPLFGSGPIYITATIGGAAPNTTGTMTGYITLVEEGN